ncbi:MAG: N-acetyltransferase [Sulfurospirillum sp.]
MVEYVTATLEDIENMQHLVAPEVQSGVILPRSDDEIATNIRSYILAKKSGELFGFGALHFHTNKLGEIRSLIVSPKARGNGVGKTIVKELLKSAKVLKAEQIFTLTYKREFFEKLGFSEIPKEDLPAHKIWADCIKCKFFPICDEIALIRTI